MRGTRDVGAGRPCWFPQALPREVLKSLELLKELSGIEDFYLAGGTGLALQTGHRPSVDLDFFSGRNLLDFDGRNVLLQNLYREAGFTLVEEKEGTLHGRIGKTALSFFRYSYPLIRPLRRREGISIASIEDIALMKLGALIGRGMRKDFIDLYFILQNIRFQLLLRLARKKFRNVEDFPLQVLKAFVFFEDAEKERMPLVHKKVSWPQIRIFFESQASSFRKKPDRFGRG